MGDHGEPWPILVLQSVAGVLGDTDRGLTGKEIGLRLELSKGSLIASANT